MKPKLKFDWRFWLFGLVLLYIVWLVGSFIWLGLAVQTRDAAQLAKSGQNLANALEPISNLTLRKIPEIEVIAQGAKILATSARITPLATQYSRLIWPDVESNPDRQKVADQLKSEMLAELSLINGWWLNLENSLWWQLVPLEYRQLPIPTLTTDISNALTYLTTDSKTFLIVFQNTQELRATGGFMGSYAKVELRDGLMTNLEIQDIYQPAGQFKGFIKPPDGVAEYLSGGQGLKLSDANWWPDFPESAQTVLSYFAFGKQQQISGLLAVNLEVAEDLLRVLGPVRVEDYDVIVTPENLATVARADRSEFFPGSQQKAHFLTLLFNQLKFKLTELSQADFAKLADLWTRRILVKDLQFYSSDEAIQALAVKYGLSGQTSFQPKLFGDFKSQLIQPTALQPLYLQLVESNVGINKANANISRSVTTQVLANQLQLQIEFANKNPHSAPAGSSLTSSKSNQAELTNGLGYVNYQRLIVSPFMRVADISNSKGPILNWHETLVTWSGVTLKQIGFLVTVPEASQQQITLILEPDASAPVTNLLNLPGLTLQKQAGLPATPYEVVWGNQSQSLVLETDNFIKF